MTYLLDEYEARIEAMEIRNENEPDPEWSAMRDNRNVTRAALRHHWELHDTTASNGNTPPPSAGSFLNCTKWRSTGVDAFVVENISNWPEKYCVKCLTQPGLPSSQYTGWLRSRVIRVYPLSLMYFGASTRWLVVQTHFSPTLVDHSTFSLCEPGFMNTLAVTLRHGG